MQRWVGWGAGRVCEEKWWCLCIRTYLYTRCCGCGCGCSGCRRSDIDADADIGPPTSPHLVSLDNEDTGRKEETERQRQREL